MNLSPREVEVMRLAMHGLRGKEISTVLEISEYTVQEHKRTILEKLKVKSMIQAVSVYYGLIRHKSSEYYDIDDVE